MIKKFFSVICKFILGLCFFPVVLALSFVLLLCCQAGPHIALMCLFAEVLRIFSEEKLLMQDTDYAAYAQKVKWKLIPYVF